MSKPVDFLSQQQPTEFTVRALWYLHHFAQQGEWADGFAFEKQLRSVNWITRSVACTELTIY